MIDEQMKEKVREAMRDGQTLANSIVKELADAKVTTLVSAAAIIGLLRVIEKEYPNETALMKIAIESVRTELAG